MPDSRQGEAPGMQRETRLRGYQTGSQKIQHVGSRIVLGKYPTGCAHVGTTQGSNRVSNPADSAPSTGSCDAASAHAAATRPTTEELHAAVHPVADERDVGRLGRARETSRLRHWRVRSLERLHVAEDPRLVGALLALGPQIRHAVALVLGESIVGLVGQIRGKRQVGAHGCAGVATVVGAATAVTRDEPRPDLGPRW